MSAAPQPPKSMYSMGTAANMVRSLIVIGALMAALWFLVPRSDSQPKPHVDVLPVATAAAGSSGMPIEVPKGLSGWTGRRAGLAPGTDRVLTFTAVYTTPSGKDATLVEARAVTAAWLAKATSGGDRGGPRRIGARDWTQYEAGSKKQVSLVVRAPDARGMTIVLTSTGSTDELAQLAGALTPVSASATGTPSAAR